MPATFAYAVPESLAIRSAQADNNPTHNQLYQLEIIYFSPKPPVGLLTTTNPIQLNYY